MRQATLLKASRTSLLGIAARRHTRQRCRLVSASLVPNYPRLGEPIRDWIASTVPQLPGFNGEDLTRIFFQDFQIDPVGALTKFTIGGALLVAFIYWEGGIILHEIERRRDEKGRGGQEGEGPSALPPRPNEPTTPQQEALYERKRGLAWLAIVTALFIWCTGVVNRPMPFMP